MTYLRTIEKGTSVKAIGVLEEPTPEKSGLCDFLYRNQYSVFDWGKMPMPEGKDMDNRPVALVAAFNYELIRKLGIPVCYEGTVNGKGDAHSVDWFRENSQVPNALRLRMVNIIKPAFDGEKHKWNYAAFEKPAANNYVLPIEFIWRAEAGPDSSFWKNIEKGNYKLEDFGLPATLKPGDKFPAPILDHSSKYEDHDRYFAPHMASWHAALSMGRWNALSAARHTLNDALSGHARAIGINRPDGKQEFAVISDSGEPVDALADVAGTWHEDRFEYVTKAGKKVKVSKQTPRDLNKILNAEWAKQCTELKERSEREGLPNWREMVTVQPQPLEPAFFDNYNNLMYAATNAWVGWNAFPQASNLEEACVEFDKYLSDYKARLQKPA